MGGGGGGAGGSVYLSAQYVDLAAGALNVAGGAGGAPGNPSGGSAGGAGSQGRVRIDAPGLVPSSNFAGLSSAYTSNTAPFDWASAIPLSGAPVPQEAGAAESFDASGLPVSQTLRFAVRSADSTGNLSALSNVALVDNAPPTVAIIYPAAGATVTRPDWVMAEAQDAGGLDRVTFYVDNVYAAEVTAPPYRFAWDVRAVAPGPHTLKAVAKDNQGLEAQHEITVDVMPALPPTPSIHTPPTGLVSGLAHIDVAGTAESGTDVQVFVDGALAHTTTATGARLSHIPLAGSATLAAGLEPTADGSGLTLPDAPSGDAIDYALASGGASISGGNATNCAIDGTINYNCYWWQNANCNETLTYMGRITFSEPRVVDTLRLLLWNNDGRFYYNYRVDTSDGTGPFESWIDQTGSGVNYQGWQTLPNLPRIVQHIDVYLSGNTVNCQAHIVEVEALHLNQGLAGLAVSPWIQTPDAQYATGFAADADSNDGTLTYDFFSRRRMLFETFSAVSMPAEIWTAAHGVVSNGQAVFTGQNTWTAAHLSSNQTFSTQGGLELQARVNTPPSGGAQHMMIGFRHHASAVNYTTMPYAIYFDNGAVRVYEDGNHRGHFANYTFGQSYDIRLVIKVTGGATYFFRNAGAPNWTQLYDTTYQSGTLLRVHANTYSRPFGFDDIGVRGWRWSPVSELAMSDVEQGALRFRALVSRPTVSDTSPVLRNLQFFTTNGLVGVGAGAFRAPQLLLSEGTHELRVAAVDAVGASALSPPVFVTIDTGPPDAIADLSATPQSGGLVLLQWSAPTNETPTGYAVYRSVSPITDLLSLSPIATPTATSHVDVPGADGTYYYVVVSFDGVGNQSQLSNLVSAQSSQTGPSAAFSLSPAPPIGLGPATVTITLSKEVQVSAASPVFTWKPAGAAPIPMEVEQSQVNPKVFTATLNIDATTPSGTAEFAWSGVDLIGNLGTGISSGRFFGVDTVAPWASIVTTPASPVRAGGLSIALTASEPLAGPPSLALAPEGKAPVPISLSGGPTQWIGTLTIDATTGDGLAQFEFSGADVVGNQGTALAQGAQLVIDTTPPLAPSLTVGKNPAGYFELSWPAPGAEAGLTYRVYRKSEAFTSTLEATLVSTTTALSAVNQPPIEGLWYFALTATDAAGNISPLSNVVPVNSDPPPPEDVTNLALSAIGYQSLTVSWTPSANSTGLLAGYRAYLNGAMLAQLPAGATSYTFGNLQPASSHALKISTYDTNNRESIGASMMGHTWVSNPGGVSGSPIDGGVQVSWSPINAPGKVLYYAIYVSSSPFSSTAGLTPAATANPNLSTAAVLGLQNGLTYYVAVATVNLSVSHDPVLTPVSVVPVDAVAPEPPTGLLVSNVLDTQLDLTWTGSLNTAGDLAGYRVKLGGTLAGTVGPSTTTFSLQTLAPATAYSIAVSAYDHVGNESNPAIITGYTLLANPTSVVATGKNKSLQVSWAHSQPQAHVAQYRIYVLPGSFASTQGLTPAATVPGWATTTTVGGLNNGSNYFVAVTAVNHSGGERKQVTPVQGTPVDDAPPPNPTAFSVVQTTSDSITVVWNPSSNPEGDLAGHKLYVGQTLAATLGAAANEYTVSGLNAATAYTLRVTAYDLLGNESSGAIVTGYTLMGNPSGVNVTQALHGKLVLGWTPPNPVSNVSHYRIYVSTAPFATVQGMAATLTASAASASATVSGLTNGVQYYLAVTAVNKSNGETKDVTPTTGTPVEDTTGPTVQGFTYNGAGLAPGGTVAVDGTFAVLATDPEGLGWARFRVDGVQIGFDSTPSNGLTASWTLDEVADGPHVLSVDVADSLGNETQSDLNFVVQLAAPGAPTITAPAPNFATNQPGVLVQGTARRHSTVRVYIGGVAAPNTTQADAAGNFSLLVNLAPGTNSLQASASNSGGESPLSAAREVVYDNSTPPAPKALTATAREAGEVRLQWFEGGAATLSGTAGYRIYRAAAPFTDPASAQVVNPSLTMQLTFDDLPPADGTWHYAVSVFNKAGTQSALSPLAQATADSVPPRAESITYTPQGAYQDGVFGQGPVAVEVTFSEPLLTLPFLSLSPPGGLPLPVGLSKKAGSELIYQGNFEILPSTMSGVAQAVLSARDLVNNRGTQIVQGESIIIDTKAPSVTSLDVTPANPIQTSSTAPTTVTVSLELDEPLPVGTEPELTYTLSLTDPTPRALPLAPLGPTTWTGGFILPEDAGSPPESLSFAYLGIDELGNESTQITGKSTFEVYQGALPPLSAPLGLSAAARPAGVVELNWQQVGGASEYQIFRQGPGEGTLASLVRVAAPPLFDPTPQDGIHVYTVASVRQANGQESLSAQSPSASANADATAPGAPTNLQLTLAANGVFAQWNAPAPFTEPVQYQLYRAGQAEITDVSGLQPLLTQLTATQVVDTAPSQAQPAYVVVARDAAGNLSPPSNSVYLNVSLLPVSSLHVVHDLATGLPPVVSWTHGSASLAGFGVSINGADLPSGPVVASPWADTSYGGTSARTYGVRAIDINSAESLERTITLAPIAFSPKAGTQLVRGQINPVVYTVSSPVSVVGVQLRALIGGVTHLSEPFSLQPGAPIEVPVVVGGYSSLPSSVVALTTARQEPNAGERVDLIRQGSLPVNNGAYAVQLFNESYTRGTTGQSRFTFFNTGAAPVEIITATSGGASASTQVRLTLLDADGNVLSTAPLKQTIGEGQIVQLASGQTVARIEPGDSFTSAPITISVPMSAPDVVTVRLTIDEVHYKLGTAQAVKVQGLSTTAPASLVEPPYMAQVDSISPEISKGEVPIVITGHATLTGSGAPAANMPVRLFISLAGFERSFDLFADAQGAFSYAFTPQGQEGGVYQVWANYPGLLGKTVQGTFTVKRAFVGPPSANLTMAAGYSYTIPAGVSTLAGGALTNFRFIPGTLPTGVDVQVPPAQDIPGAANVPLPIVVTASGQAPSPSSFVINAISDDGTHLIMPVNYTVTSANPVLTVKPTYLETGLAREATASETLVLGNKGLSQFTNLELSLLNSAKTSAAPSWAFIASAKNHASLPVGGSITVTLFFSPTAGTPLSVTTPHQFWLRASSGGQTVADIPVYVWVNDSGQGNQLFKVSDIYTGTVKDGQIVPGVAGAKVEVDRVLGSPFSATILTDVLGEAYFSGLPTGSYQWRASAAGKQAGSGTFVIKPGVTGITEVFLSTPLVTIEWDVTEITIQDKYEIVLQAVFETDVPAAVVVAEPVSVALPPMNEGDVFYGEYKLTNHGLIRAEEFTNTLPSSADYKIELLVQPPEVLNAKQSVTIPYRVTRLTPPPGGNSSGGGCITVGLPVVHCYGYKCANGQWEKDCGSVWYTATFGNCGGGSSSGPSSGCGAFGCGWWGWWGGTGSGGTTGPWNPPVIESKPVPGSPGCDPCEHPSLSPAEKDCCTHNKSQPTGSAVDLITGRYTDDATDLQVHALGFDGKLSRYFYNDQWHFRFFDTDLEVVSTAGDIGSLRHMGVTYNKADATGTIYKAGELRLTQLPEGSEGAWRWENRAGDFRLFDASGKLLSFGDRNGNAVALQRDAQSRISALLDTFGSVLASYTYAGGQLVQIQTPDGRSSSFSWTQGRLTQVTTVLGEHIGYTYDSNGRMTNKTFPNGLKRTIAYSGNGVVASVLDEAGQGTYFDYGYNETTEQNYSASLFTDGTLIEKWFDKRGNIVAEQVNGAAKKQVSAGQTMSIASDGSVNGVYGTGTSLISSNKYGPFDLLTEYTDERGIKFSFEYDAKGNMTRETAGVGRPDSQTIEYTYDANGRMTSRIRKGKGGAPNLVETYERDSAGRVTLYTDADGQQEALTYHATGKVATHTNARGDVLHHTYDAAGRLTQRRLVPADESAELIESWARGPALDGQNNVVGTQVQFTDRLGQTAILRLDSRDRLVASTDAFGRTATTAYDGQGRVVQIVDSDGVIRSFEYETLSFGETRTTEKVAGVEVKRTEYDDYGRIKRIVDERGEHEYFYAGASPDPSEIVHEGYREIYTFNLAGRVTGVQFLKDDGTSLQETFSYEGRTLTSVVNALGEINSATLDVSGEVLTRSYGGGLTETHQRDAYGRRTALVAPGGLTTAAFTYDGSDNLLSRTLATGEVIEFSRDSRGFVSEAISSTGMRVSLEYDNAGQPTKREIYGAADPDEPEQVIEMQWDAIGRATAIANHAASRTIVWDDLARTRTETVDFGPFSKTFAVERNAQGQAVGLTMPNGTQYGTTWDAYGRIASFSIGTSTAKEWSRPTPVHTICSIAGGVETALERDALGIVKAISATAPGGATLLDLQYEVEAFRIMGVETPSGDYAYTYDEAGQILSESTPTQGMRSYTYSPNGSRTSATTPQGTTPYSLDEVGRPVQVGGAVLTWDARGNLHTRTVASQTTTFTFNAANQLVSVAGPQGSPAISYAYDGEGRRVSKTVGSETTYYLWGPDGLLAEYDASGEEIRSYGWVPDAGWQREPIFIREAGTYHWVLADATGTPHRLVTSNGQVTWSAEHEAFGRAHVAPASSVTCNLRQSSQYFDAETGLHYNTFRYYSPELGMYLSTDPLVEDSLRTNLYEFADNNPISFADRAGMGPEGSGGFNWDQDGNFTAGGKAGAGGYAGLGGEASAGVELTKKDCCLKEKGKQGQVIKGGETCVTTKVEVEGGIGVGAKGGVGPVSASATAKLATAGAEQSCSVCNQCGKSDLRSECCVSVKIKLGSVSANLSIIAIEGTLFEYEYKACYGTDGLKHGGELKKLQGKGGLGISGGGGGGAGGGGKGGGGSSGGSGNSGGN